MRRGADQRLAHLEARVPPDPETERRSRRRFLRLEVAFGRAIFDQARAAGIDTDTIAALRFADEAAAELIALGDNAELVAADQAALERDDDTSDSHPGEPDAREELWRRLRRIGASYADGSRPAPDEAFSTWLGWAMAQPPLTPEQLERSEAVDLPARPIPA